MVDLQYLLNEWSEIWEKELKEIDFVVIQFFYYPYNIREWYWWRRLLIALCLSRLWDVRRICSLKSYFFKSPLDSRIKFKSNLEVHFFLILMFYLGIIIVLLEVAKKKCTERFCVSFILFSPMVTICVTVMHNVKIRKLPLVQSTELIRFHQFYMRCLCVFIILCSFIMYRFV